LEFQNPDLRLKPEMYADVEIRVEMGKMVSVSEEAVLDTGLRRLVFVEKGPGMFEPREVALGPKAGGYVAVTKGVSPGEKVAVGANFLLDAESRLRSAGGMQGMMGQVGMGDWQMRGAYEAKTEGMKAMEGMQGMDEMKGMK
jgi:Cu(I)/Ag(I) efflux system membrane fusion protein